MKVGIIADSHDHVDRLEAAVELLDALGAQVLFHCGDVGGLEAFQTMGDFETYAVLGNSDRYSTSLRRWVDDSSITVLEDGQAVELADKRIAMAHGHFRQRLEQLIASQQYDYVLHGHSHRTKDVMVGRTRVICPGALDRTMLKTVGLLDLRRDRLQFHFLEHW
jgi:putative phosphoesterase